MNARRLRRPPTGAIAIVLVVGGGLFVVTSGSDVAVVLAIAASALALAWLHVALVDEIDPLPLDVPGAPAPTAAESASRVPAVRAELDRAISRPQYDRSVRPLLAGLAAGRLRHRRIDPATPEGRAAAVALLGAPACDYLFPDDPSTAPALDARRLDTLLTSIEEL